MAKRKSSAKRLPAKFPARLSNFSTLLIPDELARDAEVVMQCQQVLWRIERLLVEIRDSLRRGRSSIRR